MTQIVVPAPGPIAQEDQQGAGLGQPLLDVRGLQVHFPARQGGIMEKRRVVKAVDGVTFHIQPGETLGLVGESGCGKTTTGRAVLQLVRPTAGQVLFEGRDLVTMQGEALRQMRRRMQIIFQDPYGSLNPRMTAGDIIAEPLVVHGMVKGRQQLKARVDELLETVGLSATMRRRYVHEFSGGQRQRIGVARALGLQPSLIVCDEPVSALDVSIQAQIINLLEHLQERHRIAYLFIAHDLAVVRHISERVAVMYLGKMMESADRLEIYERPLHPYTQALLSAVPIPDPELETTRERIILEGDVPSPLFPPPGCVFQTRCPKAVAQCKEAVPAWREAAPGHWVACHLV